MTAALPSTAHMHAPITLHLRFVDIGRRTYRVLTLPRARDVRFSNNYFHDTWHILSCVSGGAFLGRLLWGLAFTRQPHTLLLIDEPHLVPTPFEADPAMPMLFWPTEHTALAAADIVTLQHRVARMPHSHKRVKLQTFGLTSASQETEPYARDSTAHWRHEKITVQKNTLCYRAPAAILRHHARVLTQPRPLGPTGSTHHYIAEGPPAHWRPVGEVQVFADFAQRVTLAMRARQEVLATHRATHALHTNLANDELRFEIWHRSAAFLNRHDEQFSSK